MSDDQREEKQGFGAAVAAALMLGVGVAVLLALPAIYMLGVAVYEAITTGTVRVNPSSRRAPRVWVPWPQAWAHVLGLVLIVTGGLPVLLTLVFPKVRMLTSRFWLALVLVGAPMGVVLWLTSGTLTSFGGVLFLVGFLVCVTAVFWADRIYGRLVATLVLLAMVGVMLYHMASRA